MRLNDLVRPAIAAMIVLAVSGVSLASRLGEQAAPAAQQPPAQPAPPPVIAAGEPSSVQETYDDWVVACGQRDGKKICALTQQQTDRDSRQRVLAVELNTTTADKAEGTLVLPFGLAVSKEVTLKMDGANFGSPLQFRTCISAGCLVALSFDAQAVATLKKGSALAITATADNGQAVNFTLSLKGFGNGLTRTAALSK
jgi:invasion protein IalB